MTEDDVKREDHHGFYTGVRNGLLEWKHMQAMGGGAVWLFLWALSRQTDRNGLVLYGNQVTYQDIRADLNAPASAVRTIRRWMSALVASGYLKAQQGSRGLILRVCNPKKFQHAQPSLFDLPALAIHGSPETATQRGGDPPNMATQPNRDSPTVATQGDKSGHSPPRIQSFKPNSKTETGESPAGIPGKRPSPKILYDLWQANHGALPGCRRFTPERRRRCSTRLRRHAHELDKFFSEFQEAIRRAQGSPFLRGEGEKGWKATFDWFIRDDTHYLKVLEGQYDGAGISRQEKAQHREPHPGRAPAPACEAAALKEWQAILSQLEARMNPKMFATWFEPTQGVRFAGSNGTRKSKLLVWVPSAVALRWLEQEGPQALAPVTQCRVEFVTSA